MNDSRHAAIVFNPTKISREDLAESVDPAATAAGWGKSLWFETSEDDPGVAMAQQAVDRGADVVLAVGGDGTVRAVAEGLRDTGVPLALCPQGTGNLLARNLDLTLDNLPESVDAAFNGVPRPVDLGLVTYETAEGEEHEKAFLVMAGLGLDAAIMDSTDGELKKKVGMLAYFEAGARALRGHHRMRLSYRIDGGEVRQAKLHTVVVGNCGSIGNNILLLPDAAVDDGQLDIVAVQPQGPFGWLRVFWKVLVDNAIVRRLDSDYVRRRRDQSDELNYESCREFSLTLSQPQKMQIDGDPLGEVVSAQLTVEQGGLTVMMPEGWTA